MEMKPERQPRERPSTLMRSYDFSVCPTCSGTGYEIYKKRCSEVYGNDRLIEFAHKCPTCNGGLSQRVESVKKMSNIPLAYYDKRYASFDWTIYRDETGKVVNMAKKKRVVDEFLKNYMSWRAKGYGLYIFSKTKGSGKTFLASCICNELMQLYGIRTRFVSATQLLDISKSGEPDSPDRYKREPIRLLCECGLLVIDDIGQKKTGYDWMNEVCFRIIDERMTGGLVTIFTSNLQVDDLNLDERIIERINKVSLAMSLPEYNVRAKEAHNEKTRFLKDMGLIEGG